MSRRPAELAPCVRRALAVLADEGYVPVEGIAVWGRSAHPVVALTSPTGSAVVAKLYPNGDGRAAYDHMQALGASSFGRRRDPPYLPRALAYVDEIGALVMERIDGRSLDAHQVGEPRSVAEAMELLAALHSSDVRPLGRRTPGAVVRSLRRRAARVEEVPALVEPFRSAVEALDAARPSAVEQVPGHGDFCARNLLVGPGGMVLIDWDRFRWADPAADVASFGAWSWGRAVRDGRPPNWSVLENGAAAHRRLAPAASLDGGISFYAAASLVRTAQILVRRPRQARHVPRFLDEARRLLDESAPGNATAGSTRRNTDR